MTRLRQTKTAFTAGEVSSRLLGRGDLRSFENGALTLRNVFIHATGGVSRRPGFYFVDNAVGAGRLISFEFNTAQTYLLVFTDGQFQVFRDGVRVATVPAPWTEQQLKTIVWTQSADTLLITHPDVPPKKISRTGDSQWQINDWAFFEDEETGRILQPYFKFADAEVTLTPSSVSGAITIMASADVFTAGHEGARLRIADKEVRVTALTSASEITADTIEDLESTDAVKNWQEQSFSAVRGYPVSCVFHQNRLVIGGSRDLPNRMWMSQSGDLFNFDLGEGLDDEAIEFTFLSNQVNAIRGMFSSRHLQVFTSGAEWMVTGNPITPSTVQAARQTLVGSRMDRYIPPVDVDGATVFASRSGKELREFIYTDVEAAYSANDLAILSRHLFTAPVDQDFSALKRIVFLPLENGKVATLTIYRAEAVAAWSLLETDGQVLSVAVVGDDIYMLVRRENANGQPYHIERMDDNLLMDAALEGTATAPTKTWQGLEHLEGRTVSIVADGVLSETREVENGEITLSAPARHVQIGLTYTHIVESLPPSALVLDGTGRTVRLVEAVFRIENTQMLSVDVGRGIRDVPLRSLGDDVLDKPPPSVSGDVRVRAFGWSKNNAKPLWRIAQSAPLSFSLLSVTTEIKVNE